jgi:7,8-dihydropterin-6-yl-methyl-4-(beta-D-ribofuranosyl)aminobenzene 5'-phosphate synthase
MTVSVLTENNPGSFTQGEHGLSYLIEYEGKRILFDTGQSDLFIKNAEKTGVELDNIDLIILSHGHFDHGNGLWYLPGGRLICHPGCFTKRFRKADNSYIGLDKTEEEIAGRFNLETSSDPVKISEKIYFLGEIPRLTGFEAKNSSFVFENNDTDYVMDDSSVAIMLTGGLFVITGCGHAGIVNTMEYARKVTGEERLLGIMGGFHLKENDRQTKETIKYLKKNKVRFVYPSHCTDLPALCAFYDAFGMSPVRTGVQYHF